MDLKRFVDHNMFLFKKNKNPKKNHFRLILCVFFWIFLGWVFCASPEYY